MCLGDRRDFLVQAEFFRSISKMAAQAGSSAPAPSWRCAFWHSTDRAKPRAQIRNTWVCFVKRNWFLKTDARSRVSIGIEEAAHCSPPRDLQVVIY
jgi:hypothetical protein